MTLPLNAGGIDADSGAAPQIDADQLLGHHREAEGHQQAQDRIGGVEAAQEEALEQDAEQRHRDRRQHDRRRRSPGACAISTDDVGAERVERAVRQVHHAADAEDQRQAERDQQVVAAEHEAVDHLFEQEHELHRQSAEMRPRRRRRRQRCGAAAARAPRRLQDAGVLLFGRVDDLERLVRRRAPPRRTRGSPTCPWPGPWA